MSWREKIARSPRAIDPINLYSRMTFAREKSRPFSRGVFPRVAEHATTSWRPWKIADRCREQGLGHNWSAKQPHDAFHSLHLPTPPSLPLPLPLALPLPLRLPLRLPLSVYLSFHRDIVGQRWIITTLMPVKSGYFIPAPWISPHTEA
jgi:hypothetical protein